MGTLGAPENNEQIAISPQRGLCTCRYVSWGCHLKIPEIFDPLDLPRALGTTLDLNFGLGHDRRPRNHPNYLRMLARSKEKRHIGDQVLRLKHAMYDPSPATTSTDIGMLKIQVKPFSWPRDRCCKIESFIFV